MFKKFKEAREAAHAEKARDEAEQRLAELAADATRAQEAWDHAKLDAGVTHVDGVQLKKGEVVYLVLNGVGLVEPRRGPTQWVGGSQGVSFKLVKGVRYRVGATRGHVVQGEERPVVIDTGTGVVTNQRMMFIGDKRSTEWAYAKLLGFSLEQENIALFNVSNRQKASGFAYQADFDHIVDAVVSAATAAYLGPEEHAAVVANFLGAYTEAYAAWQTVNAQLNLASPPALPPPS
jgi:hypothetical protein